MITGSRLRRPLSNITDPANYNLLTRAILRIATTLEFYQLLVATINTTLKLHDCQPCLLFIVCKLKERPTDGHA